MNEINKIKDYFNSEIQQRKILTKKLSKYIVVFDYADNIFVVLSATFGTLSVVSNAAIVGIPVSLAVASLTLVFSLTTGIIKKLLNVTRKKKKKQPCRRFLEEDFAMKIITDCRTTPAVNFKTKLRFNQHDPTMTQEQSVLSKIVTLFAAEEIILQHNVLGYRTDAYFLRYKLATEVDEQGNNSRDNSYEIKRQKAIENKLGCEFIRINRAKENFNIFVEIGKIQNHIIVSTKKLAEESTKKALVDELSNKLLRPEFKKDNSIKIKCLKYVVKKVLPTL